MVTRVTTNVNRNLSPISIFYDTFTMGKLPTEEQTKQLGLRVKKSLAAEFYQLAAENGFARMEGRFFERVFREWKDATAQQPSKATPARVVEGSVTPPKSVGRGVRGEQSA